jgi:peptide methionine sulfoxide reductase MsrB
MRHGPRLRCPRSSYATLLKHDHPQRSLIEGNGAPAFYAIRPYKLATVKHPRNNKVGRTHCRIVGEQCQGDIQHLYGDGLQNTRVTSDRSGCPAQSCAVD